MNKSTTNFFEAPLGSFVPPQSDEWETVQLYGHDKSFYHILECMTKEIMSDGMSYEDILNNNPPYMDGDEVMNLVDTCWGELSGADDIVRYFDTAFRYDKIEWGVVAERLHKMRVEQTKEFEEEAMRYLIQSGQKERDSWNEFKREWTMRKKHMGSHTKRDLEHTIKHYEKKIKMAQKRLDFLKSLNDD
jgi:hypothetical protein